jgi:hypothetical protein
VPLPVLSACCVFWLYAHVFTTAVRLFEPAFTWDPLRSRHRGATWSRFPPPIMSLVPTLSIRGSVLLFPLYKSVVECSLLGFVPHCNVILF